MNFPKPEMVILPVVESCRILSKYAFNLFFKHVLVVAVSRAKLFWENGDTAVGPLKIDA